MTKDQVVAVMIEFINNQNRVAAAMNGQQQGITLADIEKHIEQMQPSLNQLCSGIYDELAKRSIIPIG